MISGDSFAIAVLFICVIAGFVVLDRLIDGLEARIKKLEDERPDAEKASG